MPRLFAGPQTGQSSTDDVAPYLSATGAAGAWAVVEGESYYLSYTVTDSFSASTTVDSSAFTIPTRDSCDSAPTVTLAAGDDVNCTTAYTGDDEFSPVTISAVTLGSNDGTSVGDEADLDDSIVSRVWTLLDENNSTASGGASRGPRECSHPPIFSSAHLRSGRPHSVR